MFYAEPTGTADRGMTGGGGEGWGGVGDGIRS